MPVAILLFAVRWLPHPIGPNSVLENDLLAMGTRWESEDRSEKMKEIHSALRTSAGLDDTS